MKVLKIIHTLGHGGAENTFRWLAWGLRCKGIEVVAAIPMAKKPHEENWIASALNDLEVPYITFDISGSPWQLLKNIANVIVQVEPDIVHSHLLDSNFYSALACWKSSVPHVCTEHGEASMKQTTVTKVKYCMISLLSQYVICVSDAVRESVSRLGLIKRKLKTIYNGIHFLEKMSSSFRIEFNIPPEAILIGNVGNLYPVKGQKYLIRAFAEICRSHPQTFLVLVGRGGEEKNLRQMVEELKIPRNRIIFAGFRNDIENVMNAFDLYVQPSLSEGHPIAVLEAMSLGIPVVATAVGGIPELIGLNRYGTLVIPASWEDIYRGISSYLSCDNVSLEKAVEARNYTRDLFSVEKMACNYINAYSQALALSGK